MNDKPSIPTIKVSVPCFHEIAAEFEKHGVKIEDVKEFVIAKDIAKLERPIDYRAATMRRDAAGIAAQVYEKSKDPHRLGHADFINFVDSVYQYILKGKEEKW